LIVKANVVTTQPAGSPAATPAVNVSMLFSTAVQLPVVWQSPFVSSFAQAAPNLSVHFMRQAVSAGVPKVAAFA
jgi:hypothetical protein